jgi:predicted pyridoxine 5'-phosphate oxidase superfamily flavin-nucleotide-binding protein
MTYQDMHGFHEGELAVQERAGVRTQASRLEAMLDPADLNGGAGRFLEAQEFAVLTARDTDGQLWSSPLFGSPGFLTGENIRLRIACAPWIGDPLFDLPAGQAVGLLAIDLAGRRRMRVNGQLITAGAQSLEIATSEAYGNCPQFIQQRVLERVEGSEAPPAPPPEGHGFHRAGALTGGQRELIRSADTFFLGTTHPVRGTDCSHRGGPPGFVRVEADGSLWWPDYRGNNMFNSLGNLAVDDSASLLFIDWATGTTLHLSGTAELVWTSPGVPGDDRETGRRVHFQPRLVVTGSRLPLHAGPVVAYPRNPPLSAGL